MDIVFDYVDPGSYLVHLLVERRLEEPGLADRRPVTWLPLELAPPASPPLDPRDPAWRALARSVEDAAGELGVSTSPQSTIPRTRKAHELALHAAERGAFHRMHRALFRAHFQEGRDLGRVDVLVGLAESVGLDPAEARTVLGVDRFRDAVESRRASLLAEGVRGVPTLRVPGGPLLEGVQGIESLDRYLDLHLGAASDPADPTPARIPED